MKFKKVAIMGLLILTVLCLSITSVFAAKKGIVSGYIWDQSTSSIPS